MDSWGEWARWATGGVVAGVVLVWGHLTGRIKALENTIVTHRTLEQHIDSEEKQFDVLFNHQRETSKAIAEIGKSVARIEGKLSNNHDCQNEKH
jgi:hypothetical protein